MLWRYVGVTWESEMVFLAFDLVQSEMMLEFGRYLVTIQTASLLGWEVFFCLFPVYSAVLLPTIFFS